MKRLLTLTIAAMLGITAFGQAKYPYLDTKLSNKERVENLLSLLTPEEKVGLMMNKSISIDRLGIPSYNWWSEACHGVRQGGLSRCAPGWLYGLSAAHRYGSCLQCTAGI